MAKIIGESAEFRTFASLTIREVSLFVNFYTVVGLMMTMMAITSALPPHSFISLWVAENTVVL